MPGITDYNGTGTQGTTGSTPIGSTNPVETAGVARGF